MSDPDNNSAEEYGLFAGLANLFYEEELDHKCQNIKAAK